MNKFYKRFELTNKLSVIVLVVILIFFGILSAYFDFFLREDSFQSAEKRMLHAYSRMAVNMTHIENTLKTGISFVPTDEKILASIDLINHYQDKNNYSTILLDEEKKYIADELLSRVKLSFNNDIALYDENEDLISYVYVSKEGKNYHQNFISYENSKQIIYCKYEDENLYTQEGCQEYELISLKHKTYYDNLKLAEIPLISYHLDNDEIYIKSHSNILSESRNKVIGHIEMTQVVGKEYLSVLSDELDIKFTLSTEKQPYAALSKLLDKSSHGKIVMTQTDDMYSGVMSLQAQDAKVYIIAALDKYMLNTKLDENRTKLFIILFIVNTVFLLLLRLILSRTLAKPLKTVLQQINKIERGDYSQLSQLESRDELEVISKNINTLAMTIKSRESDLQKSKENLEYLSLHDPLTDLPNRILFTKKLEHAMKHANLHKRKVAILYIDLDEFKELNNSLGHEVGDQLLQEVAKQLSASLRDIDTLARVGGDEFYVLIEDITGTLEVETIIQKILSIFQHPFACYDYEVKSTGSIGAVLYPDDGEDSVALIKNVDLAMYQAKHKGKNSFSFFSKNLSQQLEERLDWIATLREAIKTCDEFLLFYQPKISTKTGKIVAIEALVRWNSSKFGFVGPDKFITLAEETKMIVKLGKWIVEQACSDFMKLHHEGYILEEISINVSSVQLEDENLMNMITQAIAKTGIQAQKIELEITESFIATNDTRNLEILQGFRDMGIGLAIDDFGTGFSSLSYLQKLPVTRLKIDKSFVDNLPDSDNSVSIVKVIVALAKTFHLQITAEGVETREQLEFLQTIECDEVQGYYYSKPLSLDELRKFYDKDKA
jgi:diguanylate cyclase (GGDEF)-like protein